MSEKDGRPVIKIDREKEERSKDISKFINEGGLGARSEYYDIEKVSNDDHRPEIKINRDKEERSNDISNFIDEGGLGTRSEYYNINKVSEDGK